MRGPSNKRLKLPARVEAVMTFRARWWAVLAGVVYSRRMTPRLVGLALLPAVALSACIDRPPTVCTDELRVHFAPSDASITARESFTASVSLSSCGGALSLVDTFRWRSDDPAIATVDSVTGRVVGQSLGTTRIHANGKSYGPVGSIAVSVQPDTAPE